MADRDDDLFEQVNGLAERLRLKGKDKEKFVHEAMTRGGYRAIPNYVPDEDEDDEEKDSSPFFGRRRRERESGRRRRREDDEDDW